jgi:Subtilase family
MRIGALRTLLASAGALLVLSALPCTAALAAEGAVSPLPASDYTVRSVCSEPAPGHAGCMALKLVARTAAARARTHPLVITRSRPVEAASPTEGAFGLRPQDLHSAYQLPSAAPSQQTIAIVDAYNDLSAEADLGIYDQTFGLPACTAANGCFTKVNQEGQPANPPFPDSQTAIEGEEAICTTEASSKEKPACEEVEEADGWSEEISLDIEVSHAVCETDCHIVLVEADSSSGSDLETAEKTAAGLGATEISNSWGGPELPGPPANDAGSAFDRPGIVITASSGDDGYLNWDAPAPGPETAFADYPASSPHVVAVGGTRLSLNGSDEWAGETVWNGNGAGGGGCSVRFAAQPWQQNVSDWSSVGCGKKRAVADVSADADPYTGMAVYDSAFKCEYEEDGVAHVVHWCTIGGTSLAAPLIAATFALAGGANGVEYPAQTLYENELADPTSLHDVTEGSNGECTKPFDEETGFSSCTEFQEAASCAEKPAICQARVGYDGPTGIGTPDGIAAFQRPTKQKEKGTESGSKGIEGKGSAGSGGGGEEVGSGAGGAASGTGTGVSSTGTGTVGGGQEGSSSASAGPIIELSGLVLTPSALIALNHPRAKVSEVGFAFTLSATARVRATLAKLVRVRGRSRWELLPGALSFAAAKGRNRHRLTNHGPLAPGRYRLTLTPQHGVARSVGFRVG